MVTKDNILPFTNDIYKNNRHLIDSPHYYFTYIGRPYVGGFFVLYPKSPESTMPFMDCRRR